MDVIAVGNKIRELRIKHGMPQQDLAERLFITRKSVSKWEMGLSYPSVDMLKKLSEVFSVSIEEILNGSPLTSDLQPMDLSRQETILEEEPIRLMPCDYFFEVGDYELTDMEVKCDVDQIKMTKLENGEKISYFTPISEFEIIAYDQNRQRHILTFRLNADFDFFNELNTRPKDITRSLLDGETYLYDPEKEKYVAIEIASDKKLYTNPAHLWGACLKEKITFLKLSIPEHKLFLWFKIQF